MSYEEVYIKVRSALENYDVTKFKTISDMMDLENDKSELNNLKCVYKDYISLCSSPEFYKIKQKYCA